jgi:hypothetical protein
MQQDWRNNDREMMISSRSRITENEKDGLNEERRLKRVKLSKEEHQASNEGDAR